jgi:hypothetical protein
MLPLVSLSAALKSVAVSVPSANQTFVMPFEATAFPLRVPHMIAKCDLIAFGDHFFDRGTQIGQICAIVYDRLR